jgi:hypothetical protein
MNSRPGRPGPPADLAERRGAGSRVCGATTGERDVDPGSAKGASGVAGRAAVGLDELGDDGQAETGAAIVAGASNVKPVRIARAPGPPPPCRRHRDSPSSRVGVAVAVAIGQAEPLTADREQEAGMSRVVLEEAPNPADVRHEA